MQPGASSLGHVVDPRVVARVRTLAAEIPPRVELPS